jgi:hypothetical protein
VVHTQDSSRHDLGERVFDFRAADTIPDWANGDVACVCHVGAKLKTLNDADAVVRRFIRDTDNQGVPKARSLAVIFLNLNI